MRTTKQQQNLDLNNGSQHVQFFPQEEFGKVWREFFFFFNCNLEGAIDI